MAGVSPTFVFSKLNLEGRTYLCFLHTSATPDDATWQASLEVTRQVLREAPSKFSTVVVTDGGAPTTAQRRELAIATYETRYPIAVVSASPLTRGVLTAISWFNPGIKAFAPEKFHDAIAWTGGSPAAAGAVIKEMQRLREALGQRVACLNSVVSAAPASPRPSP